MTSSFTKQELLESARAALASHIEKTFTSETLAEAGWLLLDDLVIETGLHRDTVRRQLIPLGWEFDTVRVDRGTGKRKCAVCRPPRAKSGIPDKKRKG